MHGSIATQVVVNAQVDVKVVANADGALLPLPTIGGVSMKNVGIVAQTGYLVVDGEIQ